MDSPLHDILFGEIPNDPARRSSVQLASELPRPRRPMPRVMRPQAGPTRAQTTYGGQQGDVSRMHGFHTDEARDRWLHGSTFADRLRGGATLAAETLGLPSVMAEAEALGRRDWASAGQEAPAAAMTAAGPALGLFGRRAPRPVGRTSIAGTPANDGPPAPPEVTRQLDPRGEQLSEGPYTFRERIGPGRHMAQTVEQAQGGAMPPPRSMLRAPPRAAPEPPTRVPVNPTRIPTRASDGSVLPAREPQPFRRTEARSDDLRDAAAMRPRESDAGSAASGQFRVRPLSVNDARGDEMFGYKEVVDESGRAVGAADVNVLPDEVSIRNIVTRPEMRRQGIATQLVQDLMREFPGRRVTTTSMTDDGAAFFGSRFGRNADESLAPLPHAARPDGGSALDASGQGRTGSPTQRLLPAIRDPATGEVFTDARGHAATFERIPMRDENTALSGTSLDDLADGSTNSGFVTPEGQFLTRPQAMEWAAQQEFGGGALQTRYDAARARWLEATNAGRADPALRAELDAAREALNAARRGPQRPPANPRPDSTLSGSAGGFAIPPVVRRDFQRLAGGRPSPAPSQRALQGPGGRLTAMSRAGAPEMRAPGSAPSGLLQTPKGASQQSAIDPRVILGGGALGMFPTGAATAALVRQNAEENAVIDRMAALQRENKRRFEELRSRRGPRPYTNPGRLDMNRVVYPFDLEAPNYGYAISPATGRPLPAPK